MTSPDRVTVGGCRPLEQIHNVVKVCCWQSVEQGDVPLQVVALLWKVSLPQISEVLLQIVV